MPPASCAATSVARSASSSEVLPWSTWPMMVTTGGRGYQRLVGVGVIARGRSRRRPSVTRLSWWPNSVDHQLGGVGVDRLVDGRHHAHAHQRLDHVGAALGHAGGQFLHRDGLGNDDLAIDLLLRLVADARGGARARRRRRMLRAPTGCGNRSRPRPRGRRRSCRSGAWALAARARRLRQALGRCQRRAHRRTAQRASATGGAPAAANRRAAHDGRTAASASTASACRRRSPRPGGPSASAARAPAWSHALLDQRVGLALDLFLDLLARLFLGQPLAVLFVGLCARLVLDGAALGVLGARAGARPRRRGWRRPGRAARASFSSSVRVRSTMPPAAGLSRRDAAPRSRVARRPAPQSAGVAAGAAPPPSFRVRRSRPARRPPARRAAGAGSRRSARLLPGWPGA